MNYFPNKQFKCSVICAIAYKQYDLLKYLFDIGAPTSFNKEFILSVAYDDEKEVKNYLVNSLLLFRHRMQQIKYSFDTEEPTPFNKGFILPVAYDDEKIVKNYLNKPTLRYIRQETHDIQMGQKIAASNGNIAMYDMLRNSNRDYCSRISYAAHHNQKTMFQYLVNLHNYCKCMCDTDIKISAVRDNNLPIMKYLVEDGMDKNYLLKLAIEHDAIYIVEWLIDNGIDVNIIIH